MSRSVLIDLPEDVSGILNQIAQFNREPLESVVSAWLQSSIHLPFDGIAQSTISEYDDIELWKIALIRLHPAQEARLDALMAGNNEGELSASERDELAALVALVNKMMLNRSQALFELKSRGYDVGLYLHTQTLE